MGPVWEVHYNKITGSPVQDWPASAIKCVFLSRRNLKRLTFSRVLSDTKPVDLSKSLSFIFCPNEDLILPLHPLTTGPGHVWSGVHAMIEFEWGWSVARALGERWPPGPQWLGAAPESEWSRSASWYRFETWPKPTNMRCDDQTDGQEILEINCKSRNLLKLDLSVILIDQFPEPREWMFRNSRPSEWKIVHLWFWEGFI